MTPRADPGGRFRERHLASPTLNHTWGGFRLKDGWLHPAAGVVLNVVWSPNLTAEPSSVRVCRDRLGHWYVSFVVPARAGPQSF